MSAHKFIDWPSDRSFSAARIARPLLQSRGCKLETRAWPMAAELIAKRFYVSGTVQGVGFRFFAERVAARLGIAGYVKNLFDGRVEVYAIGTDDQLNALKDDLARGPRMARVHRVDEHWTEILREYANDFTIESNY